VVLLVGLVAWAGRRRGARGRGTVFDGVPDGGGFAIVRETRPLSGVPDDSSP
jgi:hypothetical protein